MTLTIDPVLKTVWIYYPESGNFGHTSFSELGSVGVNIAENDLKKYHSITV